MFEIPPSAKSESWIYRFTLPVCNPFSCHHKLQLLRLFPKIADYFPKFQQAIGTAEWYPDARRIERSRLTPTSNSKMQLFFTCQCGKQIEIPKSSRGKQASSFFRCDACGVLYPSPQEILNNYSLPGKSLVGEVLPQNSLAKKSMPRDSLPRNPWNQESEFATLGLKPDWSVCNVAGDKLPRKETSTFRKIVPPVLGGLAALPIATAIMWYGFGRDVGTTARFVSQYVPWIVPEKLRVNPSRESISQKQADIPSSQLETLPSLTENDSTLTPPKIAGPPGVEAEAIDDNTDVSSARSFADALSVKSLEELNVPIEVDDTDYKSPLTPESRDSLASSISENISMLRMLKKDLYEASKEKKISLIGDYYKVAKILSEQSASLRGRSAVIFRELLEKIAVEILKDSSSKTVMKYGPIGKLPGIGPASVNDFVVTVLTIGEGDKPDSRNLWMLNEPWILGEEDVPVQMLPGAWRKSIWTVPKTYLIFGRLIESGSSNSELSIDNRGKLMLQVHMALPE